jgi:hypothetical protein
MYGLAAGLEHFVEDRRSHSLGLRQLDQQRSAECQPDAAVGRGRATAIVVALQAEISDEEWTGPIQPDPCGDAAIEIASDLTDLHDAAEH